MSKLIDEAKIKLTFWSASITHDNYDIYWKLILNQRLCEVPRFIDLGLDSGKHKYFHSKYPQAFERSPFIRLCDRIGKMLAKQ